MEVVNQLPRPSDPAALSRLVDAQRILCSRCVDEEDCRKAQALLEELARPAEAGGFDYFPALLTLGSLHGAGFEPGIPQDGARAARCYLELLSHDKAGSGLDPQLLADASMQLCALVREGRAGLEEADIRRLEALAAGEAAGSVPGVASWARFAAVEAERLLREAKEEPAARERRLAREQAREAQRAAELARQKELAEAALARAEELRQQGNDDYRQGQLPGNANARVDLARAVSSYCEATDVLSECLKDLPLAGEEAAKVRRQRGVLHSNAAQVQLTVENWAEAADLARKAAEDDPEAIKPPYRLAKAQAGLRDWEAAARTTDAALAKMEGQYGKDADDIRAELWKLAADISQALPSWQWSASKPKDKERKPAEDFERRIVGRWEYGPPGSQQCYEVRLEKWGALIWQEKDLKIDLMRKGKLRWRGEYELISGMVLHLSYEPGSDVLVTEFVPPPNVPEEQQWKGPTRFTARRLVLPAPDPEVEPAGAEATKNGEEAPAAPAAAASPRPPEPPGGDPAPPAAAGAGGVAAAEEPEQMLPDDTPTELWFTGVPDLEGRFELLPDAAPPGVARGSRAVYRRTHDLDGAPLYLWYRGGNWGLTTALNLSPLAAPFLARCADQFGGRSRHPLELRRQLWHVRRGRGQEELQSGVFVRGAAPPGAPSTAVPAGGGGEANGVAVKEPGKLDPPASRPELGQSASAAAHASDHMLDVLD